MLKGGLKMAIYMVKSDIVDMRCDAIVTATDTQLSGSRGIDKDIHEAAGPELDTECRALAPQSVGSAVITKGYNLSRYIIHAVAPVWNGEAEQYELLSQCYKNAFKLAKENHCRSLATPHISSGGFGFPPDEVLRIAVKESNEFLSSYDMDIYIVTHRQSTFNMGSKMYEEISTRINDRKFSMSVEPNDLGILINQPHETFSEMLLRKIREKGMTNSECYNKAFIDRRVFSSIINNPDYKPKKKTVASFVLALELPLDEALEMFGKAGYYLTRNSKFDIVIQYCIEKGVYDFFDVDDCLSEFAQDSMFN